MFRKVRVIFNIILISGILLFLFEPCAFSKKRIAVLGFTAKNLPEDDAFAVKEFAEVSLYKTGAFEILERSKIDLILKEQGLQMSGCVDRSCAVKVGRFLSADMVVLGSVVKLEGLTVTIKFINIEKSRLEAADSENADNRRDMQKAVDRLVRRLTDRISGKGPGLPAVNNWDYYYRGFVPGWAQHYSGRETKGYLFLGSFVLSGAFAVWGYINYIDKKDDYKNAGPGTSRSEFDKRFDDYERAALIGRASLGVFALVYIANWVDVIFFSRPGPENSIGLFDRGKNFVYFDIGPERNLDGNRLVFTVGMRL